ncbi:MAG: ATP-binding cassette domain-containing protein [Alphaproteobacteria bacterium]|nr:ATP-binding cassette domain-containing protein [Alphaproteobacteria bacterium]
MFTFENVSKSFGTVRAAHQLDLIIVPGQTTVLIGPSGCGKSTLLRLALGLIAPDSGVVQFDGTKITADTSPQLRRHMGYVIQGGGLFPHMTARANITLMARHQGWPVDRIAARLAELATLCHLPIDSLDRYPVQLSGGQRQRVALMRGLMLDPEILLLDEPFGALDPMVRFRLQTELADIFRTLGKTVVMVTHDIAEAAYFGRTIVLMRDGQIVQRGGIGDLMDAPAEPFVEEFVSAQRTLMQAVGGAS